VVELSELNLFEVDERELAKSWDRLQQLQSLAPGLQFALDDFGKGASNFDRLRALNIDAIKLDVSLIRDIDADKKAQKMLQHLNKMTDEMNVSLIAEGVETHKEETALLELGINLQQGFFRGPPVTIDALEASDSLKQV
jgi:EAL domain-containing protein (putative c-di-GMP-specific phosphodiesterase class I)